MFLLCIQARLLLMLQITFKTVFNDRGVPETRHLVADEPGLCDIGVPGSAVERAERVHADRHNAGAVLRHHTRHAAQQETLAQTFQ